nr:hypothetical protein CFP56_77542 [Quercus suber]
MEGFKLSTDSNRSSGGFPLPKLESLNSMDKHLKERSFQPRSGDDLALLCSDPTTFGSSLLISDDVWLWPPLRSGNILLSFAQI